MYILFKVRLGKAKFFPLLSMKQKQNLYRNTVTGLYSSQKPHLNQIPSLFAMARFHAGSVTLRGAEDRSLGWGWPRYPGDTTQRFTQGFRGVL